LSRNGRPGISLKLLYLPSEPGKAGNVAIVSFSHTDFSCQTSTYSRKFSELQQKPGVMFISVLTDRQTPYMDCTDVFHHQPCVRFCKLQAWRIKQKSVQD